MFEGKEGQNGKNSGQDTYLCVLLIVHMSEEVKHGPTDGVAVFAPVIASIIILIRSNGLIRLLNSWLGALSRLGALNMGILTVYLGFLKGKHLHSEGIQGSLDLSSLKKSR